MSLHETLQHRRAIRYYDPEKPLDSARVEECLRQATLAPTSSNMQLYRCYHITDPAVIAALTPACLGQSTISTAKEVVIFAITPSPPLPPHRRGYPQAPARGEVGKVRSYAA